MASDLRSFHAKTKDAKPQSESKSSTYWTAVLLFDKRLEGPKKENDYLWIKCHHKVTVQTIREQFEKRNNNYQNYDLVLDTAGTSADGGIASSNLTMRDLDHYGDHVIAFMAVKQVTDFRDPLRPVQPAAQPKTRSDMIQKDEKKPVFLPATSPSIHDPFAAGACPLAANQQAANPPFAHFLQFYRSDEKSATPDLTENQILDNIWKTWTCLSGTERAAWYKISETMPLPGVLMPTNGPLATDTTTGGSTAILVHAAPRETVRLRTQEDRKERNVDFWEFFGAAVESGNLEETVLAPPKSSQLQDFIADASLEVLEASIERGVKFLDDLKGPLNEKIERCPNASQWVQQIERLQKQATKTRTIIGVVGNTGAGKSSVINAMLDEERLVPTNTMRACTAVVTELSYNDDPDHSYRAEIEFITIADWQKDLTCALADLIDGNGEVSRDCANEDSDAGIAYAKIKAVYPKKTKSDICNSSIENMLKDVSHILGTCKTVNEEDSVRFYRHLQRYVDSKEKSTSTKDKDKKAPKELEFWPLIKVVRIYVKAPALATGAVIVDLPGVHDANAARAAVAENYMKQCTGLWIVAPIIRAVDDKAAKNLLGESFKRQLKMDGGFNSVTFICSKTDDISLMEASDSLGLEDMNGPRWAEIDHHTKTQKSLKTRLEDMRETKATYGEVMNDADDQLDIWEELREKMEQGKTVHQPITCQKRKNLKSPKGEKRRKSSSNDGESERESDSAIESDEEEDDFDAGVPTLEPLTQDQITDKIAEIRQTKKEARKSRSELEADMKAVREQIAESKQEEKNIEAEISKVCINGRNQYSKGAIQLDFAAGMKELDQEIAAEEDEESFNPGAQARDYDEVARSLPVFCVSSRGYQKLRGRLAKDSAVPGFTNLEQTEIPQLQAHCKNLTVAGRTTNCKRFMTNLSQLLNSMTMWASSDGTGAQLTPEQRAKEAKVLQKSLKKLETGLKKIVRTTCTDLSNIFQDNIYDKYEVAVASAVQQSLDTATRWGAKVNRDNRALGGLWWSSYKAVCRRNGVYTNAQGLHDWNTALSDPLLKHLSTGWETTFTRRAPAVMGSLVRNASDLLKSFHKDVEARARTIVAGVAGLPLLQQQLQIYEQIFKDFAQTTKDSINTQQKDINREFVPVVADAMEGAYVGCVNENGTGSFMRMKAVMNKHVEDYRDEMFEQAAENVRSKLEDMTRLVEEDMANKAEEVFISISRDYRSVLGGGEVSDGEVMPKWQRTMRREVMVVIDSAEKIFKRVAGLEVDEDEAERGTKEEHKEREIKNEGVKEETTEKDIREIEHQENEKNERELEVENNGERLNEAKSEEEEAGPASSPLSKTSRRIVGGENVDGIKANKDEVMQEYATASKGEGNTDNDSNMAEADSETSSTLHGAIDRTEAGESEEDEAAGSDIQESEISDSSEAEDDL